MTDATTGQTYTQDRPDDPDVIREQIEVTRVDLSSDVNALADSMRPGNLARRQTNRLRSRAAGLKDRVMGSASDLGSSATSKGSSVGSSIGSSVGSSVQGAASTVQEAPDMIRARTEGNPLAVGLIAFGAGWLLASVLPASDVEAQAAQQVKDAAAPVKESLTDAAKQAAENLKEPAQEAAQSVRETATDAAGTVRDEGRSAASEVKDQGSRAQATRG